MFAEERRFVLKAERRECEKIRSGGNELRFVVFIFKGEVSEVRLERIHSLLLVFFLSFLLLLSLSKTHKVQTQCDS